MTAGSVVELFAGVGGFRLGLEGAPGIDAYGSRWQVTWSNQWEPSTKSQPASQCYEHRFGPAGHVCEDIEVVLDAEEHGSAATPIPRSVDLLVGGFPCQDYSVAKPLSRAAGIEGKRGVLWWQIVRLIELRSPRYVLLENVDRLLKSPSSSRGRDFAIMLSTFSMLGYAVQWRVVNAADYGYPQRRRRVFILAERMGSCLRDFREEPTTVMVKSGVLARALPVQPIPADAINYSLGDDPYEVTSLWPGAKVSPWATAGVMVEGEACTTVVDAVEDERDAATLGSVLIRDSEVPDSFFIPEERIPDWAYLKGSKREPRTDKRTGHRYFYTEGAVAFPEPLDRPSRTILTGEGGTSPSRFKHVVRGDSGRLRRLVPVELERLNGFPPGWTAEVAEGVPMPDGRRAFMMGNALVVGIVNRIGEALADARDEGRSTFG